MNPEKPQRYNPRKGDTIESVAYNTCLLADSLGKPVEFKFQGITLVVTPGSSDDQVAQDYRNRREQHMLLIKSIAAQHPVKLEIPGMSRRPADHPCPQCESDKLVKINHPIPLRTYSGLYHCPDCGYRNSTTNHLGRLMFPVQKMPEGALPLYTHDPPVTDLILSTLPEDEEEGPLEVRILKERDK
jgi:predicted RNA-binding Zn-ribbon protein involved in translation (DUF1610 family)